MGSSRRISCFTAAAFAGVLLGCPSPSWSARGIATLPDSGREGAALQTCALSFTDLNQTPNLQELISYFAPDAVVGYVNETHGSYFEVDTHDRKMVMTFMTSGLFDMYLIQRSGPIMFCDDGETVVVKGIEMEDQVTLKNGVIVLGKGGPKRTFTRGPKPELLEKLHVED